jgi:hypothetical protein
MKVENQGQFEAETAQDAEAAVTIDLHARRGTDESIPKLGDDLFDFPPEPIAPRRDLTSLRSTVAQMEADRDAIGGIEESQGRTEAGIAGNRDLTAEAKRRLTREGRYKSAEKTVAPLQRLRERHQEVESQSRHYSESAVRRRTLHLGAENAASHAVIDLARRQQLADLPNAQALGDVALGLVTSQDAAGAQLLLDALNRQNPFEFRLPAAARGQIEQQLRAIPVGDSNSFQGLLARARAARAAGEDSYSRLSGFPVTGAASIRAGLEGGVDL